MVTEISCDIFLAPVDIIVHQANCHHTMGSGIARAIREKWPVVYEADCKTTLLGDKKKLGTCSIAKIDDASSRIKYVFNLYGQFNYGTNARQTNYEAFYRGLEFIKNHVTNTNLVIGIPYKIGCRLGGGSWRVCKTMIDDVFNPSAFTVLICRKPGEPD
jgi:O-acetyl-ADP-ribose deacetylase (regulator of RNase III)